MTKDNNLLGKFELMGLPAGKQCYFTFLLNNYVDSQFFHAST